MLPTDAYSFMILTKPCTAAWNTGFGVWVFQIGMYILLINDQLLRRFVYGIADNPTDIIFQLPPVVSPYVSAAQVVALLVTSLMQDDIFTAAVAMAALRNKQIYVLDSTIV